MIFILLAIAVFVAAAVLDAVESFYVRAVADLNPHRAAKMSVTMYAVGCIGFFGVLAYSWWLLIPECAGLYVGSWIAVTYQRRNQPIPNLLVAVETSDLHTDKSKLAFISSGVSN